MSLPTFPWLRTRITIQSFASNSRTRIRTRLFGHRGLSLRILRTGRRCHHHSTALHSAADALSDVLSVPGGFRAASRTGLGPCVGYSCRAGSDQGSLALGCPHRLRLHNLTLGHFDPRGGSHGLASKNGPTNDRSTRADAPAPPPVRNRSFFMAKAVQAVQRLGLRPEDPGYRDEVRRSYGLMSEMFARNPRCEYCQVLMVPVAGSSPYGPNTILPSMPSLDAIHPRSKGGTYAHDNFRLIDVGCNFVNLDLTGDEAAVLIGRLEAGRVLDVDANGMLCPATRSRVDKDTMFAIVVEAWARRTVRLVRQHNRQQHRHSADITVAELVPKIVRLQNIRIETHLVSSYLCI
ncbi:hypothetical protein BCV69DRAFT_27019 [Microstroma glucosiphilum]|uniref:Uncharacterized protein n=1 Tax=Pseudomicrostroma glucosiphilum TaxID=1684307 RepID=A0A316U2T4_9BASI|nr:hypothetical protein BCV69DRAFT_27019 [Pseudomicrostroma glucosiphilum]PWN19632.1 hypothetical protein BCV69DRAFT_27019 [Pseudomicrostroma glucosiphilum]